MMHLLFTADENYARRIPVVLESIKSSNKGERVSIHLISNELSQELRDFLAGFCADLGYDFFTYLIQKSTFSKAPVNKHYSNAMYYRLLAAEILPQDLERILYLDPDVLVINSLVPLWNMKLEEGMCFAAASHTTEEGILDNTKCRELVRRDDIFSFIRDNGYKFILPDQDVFNGLYGEMTIQIPDEIWNYDARKYSQYLMKSTGMFDEYWVIRNTAILHYCGKEKPWNSSYRFRFGNLYRHYEQLSERRGSNILKSRILPQEKNL